MVFLALAPPITAVLGFFFLGERLTYLTLLGMTLTFAGIAMVILRKKEGETTVKLSHPAKGLFYAFMGALGQAFGLISSKIGMGSYDAFSATQIRIIEIGRAL